MEAWQDRVIAEKRELDEKIAKLSAFMAGNTFDLLPLQDQGWLHSQHIAMQAYSVALKMRIAHFK